MKIICLHGVGDGNRPAEWAEWINQGLQHIGAPVVSEDEIVAPVYASMLRTTGGVRWSV